MRNNHLSNSFNALRYLCGLEMDKKNPIQSNYTGKSEPEKYIKFKDIYKDNLIFIHPSGRMYGEIPIRSRNSICIML